MVVKYNRSRTSVAAKRYAEALRKKGTSAGSKKGRHPYAYKKQSGAWRKCRFKRCGTPHKETKYKGCCSVNCQKGRTINKNSGFQFDLGHPVRSGWERKYSMWLRRIGYTFNGNYKKWKEESILFGREKYYFYEPRPFSLRGITYLPDFYLSDSDTWIEVKGYMTKKDMEKITKFRATGRRLLVVDGPFFKSKYFKGT